MHFGTPKIQFNFKLFSFESIFIVFLVNVLPRSRHNQLIHVLLYLLNLDIKLIIIDEVHQN